VPFDLLMSPMPFEARPRIEPQPVLAPPAQLDEVAALLAQSAEPIIITEHGGRTEAEAAALIALAEALSAPIFEFIMPAYHNAPRAHPLVMPGAVEPVLDRADAIVHTRPPTGTLSHFRSDRRAQNPVAAVSPHRPRHSGRAATASPPDVAS
jgi:thiamine pyrophosphate-dependent acetolactate synthase large subunit-like protein